MAAIVKHLKKYMTCTHHKAKLLPTRLLLYHNNGSLRYDNDTINITAQHYVLIIVFVEEVA